LPDCFLLTELSNCGNILPRVQEDLILNKSVYQAVLLKEQFMSVYSAQDRKASYKNLKKWIIAAIKSQLSFFIELGYKFFVKNIAFYTILYYANRINIRRYKK